MKRGISGFSVIRNAIAGDYCIQECIASMLPVSDEVVIGDASSDDGTGEMLQEWSRKEPKLRIVKQPWKQPVNERRWFVNWINQTRSELSYDQQLFLDADEVICEGAYSQLKQAKHGDCFTFRRLNFWRDARTVIAEGETCGHMVTRFGPSALFMPSDEPYGIEDIPEIIRRSVHYPALRIFHYGFLRSREGMVQKSKVNLKAFFGTFDSRVAAAAANPDQPWHDSFKHEKPYTTYAGGHPEHCLAWLRSRKAL